MATPRPVEVEARFDRDGQPTPLAVVLDGRRFHVLHPGRRRQDARGLHCLVMVEGDRIYELTFDRDSGRWTARREAGGPAVA